MDAIWAPLGIGLAVLLFVALGVAWWEHRQRLADMQRRLEHSEHSRFMLEQQAGEMDARLVALSEALATRPAGPAGDQASRAATLSTAMKRMGARPAGGAGDAPWEETEPMVLKPSTPPAPPVASSPPDFAPTMPAAADLGLPPR
jgi:hypothetical protein